jgi:hypothetical protein
MDRTQKSGEVRQELQRRKTGNGPTVVCSPEPLDLVAWMRLCTPCSAHPKSYPYGHRSGSRTCGENETNAAGWQMGTDYGLHRLLEIVVWAGDGSCTHCAAISLGFPAAMHSWWRGSTIASGEGIGWRKSMGRVSSLQTQTLVRKSTIV